MIPLSKSAHLSIDSSLFGPAIFSFRGNRLVRSRASTTCRAEYYDPIVKRFLNADSYASTGQGFLGYNMFAYCGNNPIINQDPSGELLITTLILASLSSTYGGEAMAKNALRQIEQ